jgi:flagella basal body P-ring formation protein FlgA
MSPAAFADALAAWVTATCGASGVDVTSTGIDPALLDDQTQVQFTGAPCRSHPTLRADLSAAGEHRVLTFRPTLSVWTPVPVAAEDTPAGGVVRVSTGQARMGGSIGPPIRTPEPWLARRDLAAGTPLTSLNAESQPDVRSGAPVTVVLGRSDIWLTAPGRLLEPGRLGDEVRVAVATGAVLRGALTASDRVEIP